MTASWDTLHRLLEEGIKEEVYTGAVALVGLRGELKWEAAVGQVSRDPEAHAATPETVFDLASLTKPLATALALLLLMARGRVELTTTLGKIITAEWLPIDKRSLTIS